MSLCLNVNANGLNACDFQITNFFITKLVGLIWMFLVDESHRQNETGGMLVCSVVDSG